MSSPRSVQEGDRKVRVRDVMIEAERVGEKLLALKVEPGNAGSFSKLDKARKWTLS